MGNYFSVTNVVTFFSISFISSFFYFKKKVNPIYLEVIELKKEKKYSECQEKLEKIKNEKIEYLVELSIIYLLNKKEDLFLNIKDQIPFNYYPLIMKQTQNEEEFRGLEFLAKGNNYFEKGNFKNALENYELSLFLYKIDEEAIHNTIYSCIKLNQNEKALFYSSIEFDSENKIKENHKYLQNSLKNSKKYDGIYSFSFSDSKILKK